MEVWIKGKKTWLREIGIKDAADICGLRNDKRINKYLSTSRTVSVEEQEKWITNNLAKKDGCYLKITEANQEEICGTVSIYNILKDEADFGRYICIMPVQAVETEYLILNYGFNVLKLNKLFCRVVIENKKVWKQHHTFGFVDTGEEVMETPDKVLRILVQELTRDAFNAKDYSSIQKLIDKF